MTLLVLDELNGRTRLNRIAHGEARGEFELRDLLFDHPEILPLAEIDPSFGPVVPVATELNVPGVGRIDAVFIDRCGRLVILECKLWRNPEARREVIAQILDYAREVAQWRYEDLLREVSNRLRVSDRNILFELARNSFAGLTEASFVDHVAQNLKAGRFLLVIAGDGIKEGTERIGEYLKAQPGLAFGFGMIEVAAYSWFDASTGRTRRILHPRVLARSIAIERHVIRFENDAARIEVVDHDRRKAAQGDAKPSDDFRVAARRFVDQLIAELPLHRQRARAGYGAAPIRVPGILAAAGDPRFQSWGRADDRSFSMRTWDPAELLAVASAADDD